MFSALVNTLILQLLQHTGMLKCNQMPFEMLHGGGQHAVVRYYIMTLLALFFTHLGLNY